MRATEIQIGEQNHLQSAAGGDVFKIGPMRRNEQLCSEKSGLLAAKLPGYVGLSRFNLLQVDSVWQKNGKPWFWCDRFRIRFVNLNFDIAGLHTHVGESPLANKDAQRIKCCCDAVTVERLHRFLSIARSKTLAIRCECARAPNWCKIAMREVQTFRCLTFHGSTK